MQFRNLAFASLFVAASAVHADENPGGTGSSGPIRFHITGLGTLGGDSYGTGLNDAGTAVGWSRTLEGDRGFIWTQGAGLVSLPPQAGRANSRSRAINAGGLVVGWSGNANSIASEWNAGTASDIATPSGSSPSYASDVNASGTVAGHGIVGSTNKAFTASSGGLTLLNPLAGQTDSIAYGINANGTTVGASLTALGSTAVLWSGSSAQSLGFLPGGAWSIAFDVNDQGDVVGHGGSTSGQRAWLYRNGSMTSLGALSGDTYSSAFAINGSGWVVGSSGNTQGRRGFLYRNGQMDSLDSLIDDPSAASTWQIFDAQAINSSGQIVGTGYQNGQLRAYLMTPVPEPASLIALGIGLAAIRRRRA